MTVFCSIYRKEPLVHGTFRRFPPTKRYKYYVSLVALNVLKVLDERWLKSGFPIFPIVTNRAVIGRSKINVGLYQLPLRLVHGYYAMT